MKDLKPADHPAIPAPRVGVLLVNLGTPDAPEPRAVRRYLKEFLSDPRVIELPPLLWQPILRGVVLTTRPKKSAHAYKQVWREDGSPLAAITREQAQALQTELGEGVLVDHAMRYGSPAIADRLAALKAAGCQRILIAALYPQYCAATTATVHDRAFLELAGMRWQPAIRTLPPYYDDPAYIDALKRTIEAQIAALPFTPEILLASFHGMPEATLFKGDPYHCHCQRTARLLSEALGREVLVSFQSRFGKAKWLGPATDITLEKLARDGVRRIAVTTPGFAADCVETLEEIAIQGRATFLSSGGQEFAYLPCLNAGRDAIAMLGQIVRRELSGWIP